VIHQAFLQVQSLEVGGCLFLPYVTSANKLESSMNGEPLKHSQLKGSSFDS